MGNIGKFILSDPEPGGTFLVVDHRMVDKLLVADQRPVVGKRLVAGVGNRLVAGRTLSGKRRVLHQ